MGVGGMVERPAGAGKGPGRGLGAPGAAGALEGWGEKRPPAEGLGGSGNLGGAGLWRPGGGGELRGLQRGERAWEAPGWGCVGRAEGPRRGDAGRPGRPGGMGVLEGVGGLGGPGVFAAGGRRVGGSWGGPAERRFFSCFRYGRLDSRALGGRGGRGGLILIRIQSFIDNG